MVEPKGLGGEQDFFRASSHCKHWAPLKESSAQRGLNKRNRVGFLNPRGPRLSPEFI